MYSLHYSPITRAFRIQSLYAGDLERPKVSALGAKIEIKPFLRILLSLLQSRKRLELAVERLLNF